MRRTKFFFLLVASVFILIQGKTSENAQPELDLIHDNDAIRKDNDMQEVKAVSEPHEDNDAQNEEEVQLENSVLETNKLVPAGARRRYRQRSNEADSTSLRRQSYRLVRSEDRNNVCENRVRNNVRRHMPENMRTPDQSRTVERLIQTREFQRRTRINDRREINERRLLRRTRSMERQTSERTIDRRVGQRRDLQLATRIPVNNEEKRDARRSDGRSSNYRITRESRELRKSVRLVEEACLLNNTVNVCSVPSVAHSDTRRRTRLDIRRLNNRLKTGDENVVLFQRREGKGVRSPVERFSQGQGREQELSRRRMSSVDVRRINTPSTGTDVQRRNLQEERLNSVRRIRNNNRVFERTAEPSSRRGLHRKDSFDNVRQKRQDIDIRRDFRRLAMMRDNRRLRPFDGESFASENSGLDTSVMKQYTAEQRVDISHNQRRSSSPIQNRMEKSLHDEARRVTFRTDKDMTRRTQITFRSRERQFSPSSRRIVPTTLHGGYFSDFVDCSTLARTFVVGMVALLGTNMWTKSV